MKQNIIITDYACNKCKNKYIDSSLLDEQNDLNLPVFMSPYSCCLMKETCYINIYS